MRNPVRLFVFWALLLFGVSVFARTDSQAWIAGERASLAEANGRSHSHIQFASQDGTKLHGSLYDAEGQTKAALVFVHGLQSHAGWYDAGGMGDVLARNGIASLAFDRRGSGKSAGLRGHAKQGEDFLRDLQAAVDELSRRIPAQTPIHILANCFGSRTAIPYVSLNKNIRSLLITSPAVAMAPRADYSAADKLRILLLTAGTLGQNSTLKLATPLRDTYFVSSGPMLKWINDDSLSLRKVTLGFLKGASKLTKKMDEVKGQIKTPLFVMLASNDLVVENDKIIKEFYNPYLGPKQITVFDSEHYLDFGKSRDLYHQAVRDWILSFQR